MRILLLSKYSRKGASSRLRTLQYVPMLDRGRIQVDVHNLFDDEYLDILYSRNRRVKLKIVTLYLKRFYILLRSSRYELIWIEKEVFPYLPAFAERLLNWLKIPYVVDYDDAIFHNYDKSSYTLIRATLGHKIDVVMRKASLVIAGNNYLADRAKRAGAQRIEIIPTVVDHTRYRERNTYDNAQPVIGWIGSPSTQRYLASIHEPLKVVCANTGAKLLVIGATEDIVSHLPDIELEILPWSEGTEVELITRMDIGIMPLDDGLWERGKCGYKLIQYIACGVPVVASPIGVNVDIVNESRAGYLAGTEDEWVAHLTELVNNKALRILYGRSGREAVERVYSLHVQAPRLTELFTGISHDRQGSA